MGRTVYHVAVMPCYDKKLEASRQDFVNTNDQTRDVDTVITSSEYICVCLSSNIIDQIFQDLDYVQHRVKTKNLGTILRK